MLDLARIDAGRLVVGIGAESLRVVDQGRGERESLGGDGRLMRAADAVGAIRRTLAVRPVVVAALDAAVAARRERARSVEAEHQPGDHERDAQRSHASTVAPLSPDFQPGPLL